MEELNLLVQGRLANAMAQQLDVISLTTCERLKTAIEKIYFGPFVILIYSLSFVLI